MVKYSFVVAKHACDESLVRTAVLSEKVKYGDAIITWSSHGVSSDLFPGIEASWTKEIFSKLDSLRTGTHKLAMMSSKSAEMQQQKEEHLESRHIGKEQSSNLSPELRRLHQDLHQILSHQQAVNIWSDAVRLQSNLLVHKADREDLLAKLRNSMQTRTTRNEHRFATLSSMDQIQNDAILQIHFPDNASLGDSIDCAGTATTSKDNAPKTSFRDRRGDQISKLCEARTHNFAGQERTASDILRKKRTDQELARNNAKVLQTKNLRFLQGMESGPPRSQVLAHPENLGNND